MSDPKPPPPTPPLATWQKTLLGIAAATGVVGAGLVLYAASGGDPGVATERAEDLRAGLVSGSAAADAGDATRAAARLWGEQVL